MIFCLRLTIATAVFIASYGFSSEDALVFEYEPLDVQTFEGNDETVSFKCNASSNGDDAVFYRWYFRPPNGTFTPIADGTNNEIIVTKPSKPDHGYYLCQAYNYQGSIQSRIAELHVLRASAIWFSFMANFSLNWFALNTDDNNNTEGSGSYESVNVTDRQIIKAALESAYNSSNVTVKLDSVIDEPGGSQVKARIMSVCTGCDLVNYSLDNVENTVMELNEEFDSLVNYTNNGIISSQFVVAGSSNAYVRMQVVMAMAGNTSIDCPQTMSISDNHFFVCVNCAPGHYSRQSSCAPCELGQYQDRQGQTSCKQCPRGKSTSIIGASSVEECTPEASNSPSEGDDNDGGAIAAVVISVLFVVVVVAAVIVYMLYKGYRRKKGDEIPVVPPTMVIQNSAVLPLAKEFSDDDENLSEIPTIRYEKPPTSQSVKKSAKLRKNHQSEKVTRRSQEVYKWNRAYSVAHMKKKYPNGSRIPSCYPIGEYVGSLSDNEGDMYDHVTSPSATDKRRSMSVSDLTSVLNDISSVSLQVPSFLNSIHAKYPPHRLNSKPHSGPPGGIEMDDDMSDLYDSTLRRSGRDRSNTLPTLGNPQVRLSGMKFSLGSHNDSKPVPKTVKRESSKSVSGARPVTQYVNSEIVEQHRESIASNTPDMSSRVQSPSPVRDVKFAGPQEEEPTYVTMKPARGKRSLPNLESYFTQQERPSLTKPLSLHDDPADFGPPIELIKLETLPRRDSIDINHVVSDSEA